MHLKHEIKSLQTRIEYKDKEIEILNSRMYTINIQTNYRNVLSTQTHQPAISNESARIENDVLARQIDQLQAELRSTK